MRYSILIVVLSILITPISTYPQEFKIAKALDTNLFELRSKEIVKIKNLRTPSINTPNQEQNELAQKIYKWVDSFFSERNFRFEFTNEEENNVKLVNIYRMYKFGEDQNVIELYLANGFGEYTGEKNDTAIIFLEKEALAKKNELGIWGAVGEELNDEYNVPINTVYEKIEYTRPYLMLLPLALLSFGIAWDQFEDRSNIQKEIDLLVKMGRNDEADDLKVTKTQKTVVGIVAIITGVATTFFALKEVEVRADYDNVSLGVHIPLNE